MAVGVRTDLPRVGERLGRVELFDLDQRAFSQSSSCGIALARMRVIQNQVRRSKVLDGDGLRTPGMGRRVDHPVPEAGLQPGRSLRPT